MIPPQGVPAMISRHVAARTATAALCISADPSSVGPPGTSRDSLMKFFILSGKRTT